MLTMNDRLGEPLDKVFDKWDPVLQKISESHPSFVMYLAEELVHSLVFDPANNSSTSAQAEALFLWLIHLLTSSTWEPHRPFCPRSYILTACSEDPNHWAKMLSDRLQEEDHRNEVPGAQHVSRSRSSKKSSYPNSSIDVHSSMTEKLRQHGWEPVKKWDSRPLGIASS